MQDGLFFRRQKTGEARSKLIFFNGDGFFMECPLSLYHCGSGYGISRLFFCYRSGSRKNPARSQNPHRVVFCHTFLHNNWNLDDRPVYSPAGRRSVDHPDPDPVGPFYSRTHDRHGLSGHPGCPFLPAADPQIKPLYLVNYRKKGATLSLQVEQVSFVLYTSCLQIRLR